MTRIKLANAPKPRSASVERIDSAHANAKAAWAEMGASEYLSAAEVEHLQEASRMGKEPHRWKYEEQELHLNITLPPHAVAAITIEFTPDPGGGVHA
jgi:xylan 1,4-beta-xylosidase